MGKRPLGFKRRKELVLTLPDKRYVMKVKNQKFTPEGFKELCRIGPEPIGPRNYPEHRAPPTKRTQKRTPKKTTNTPTSKAPNTIESNIVYNVDPFIVFDQSESPQHLNIDFLENWDYGETNVAADEENTQEVVFENRGSLEFDQQDFDQYREFPIF